MTLEKLWQDIIEDLCLVTNPGGEDGGDVSLPDLTTLHEELSPGLDLDSLMDLCLFTWCQSPSWQEFVCDDGLVIITTNADLSRKHGEIKGLPATKSEAHVLLNYGQWVKLNLLSKEDKEKIIKFSDGRVDPPYEEE